MSSFFTDEGMNTPVQSSHEGGRHRNTAGKLVRILETRGRKLRRTARLALQNPVRRRLLKYLTLHDNGVTYRQLFEVLPVSERWVRELVADLRRDGLVETPGSPAQIQFTTDDLALAVKELLAFIASEWVDAFARDSEAATALDLLTNDPDHESSKYIRSMVRILRGDGGGR